MNNTLDHGSWKIVTVMGIPIKVHFSWLIIFGLITWSLSTLYFPQAAPQLPALSYWAGGLAGATLLFISVALHELSHSFVATRYRLPIISITLFIFGGVAQMKGEPPHSKAEARMAVAGPLSSFVLSLIFLMIYELVTGQVARALFLYLSRVNFILGAFNLIPGFPMDGGRVLRAFLWKRTGDFFYATRRASTYGQRIALFFIIIGLFSMLFGFPGSIWLMLIGWFLYTAAQASYQQAGLQESLSGRKVMDLMIRDFISIPPDMTIKTAVDDYFLRYGYGGFPVIDNAGFLGFVTLKEVKDVPKGRWKDVRVSEVCVPHEKRWEVSEENTALKALELMINEDKGRLVVIEKGNVTGIITRNGIAKYASIMEKQSPAGKFMA